jgi:hypothetical protein
MRHYRDKEVVGVFVRFRAPLQAMVENNTLIFCSISSTFTSQ